MAAWWNWISEEENVELVVKRSRLEASLTTQPRAPSSDSMWWWRYGPTQTRLPVESTKCDTFIETISLLWSREREELSREKLRTWIWIFHGSVSWNLLLCSILIGLEMIKKNYFCAKLTHSTRLIFRVNKNSVRLKLWSEQSRWDIKKIWRDSSSWESCGRRASFSF